MSCNFTEMRRYEQLIDQLDAATSRLESRFEEIERRVTKLQVLKSTHGEQRYAGFYSGVNNAAWSPPPPPRRRRTCWDPPLYETDPCQQPTRLRPCHGQPPGWPPPQRSSPTCWPTQRRRHAYGKQQQTHTYRQQQQPVAAHTEPLNSRFGDSRPVFEQSLYTCTVSDSAPQNFVAEYQVGQSDYLPPHPPYTDSYGQPHNSSARCRLWQLEPPLPNRRCDPPMLLPRSAPECTVSANSSAATTQSLSCHKQPTVVLQPLLSSTSLRRSAISSMASAAAPPPQQPQPPLPPPDHQPQQPSPAPPLELLTYSAPRPSQPLHPLSVTVPLLASNHHSQAVPSSRKKEWQTNLQDADEYGLLNEVVPCLLDVVLEECIVEAKLKENGIGSKGLIGSKIFMMIEMIIVRAFDPGICVSFSKRNREFLAMQMEIMDLCDSKKELPHEEVIKCLFATEIFRIELHISAEHVVFTTIGKFHWDDDGRRSAVRCTFDPGGDTSPKLLLSTLRCFVFSTLRTR